MIIAEFRVISISMSISNAICFIKKSFHEILLTVTMEMNKTVDDPQGSTEALSESLPRETLPTGTQVETKEAQHVSTEAHSMSMEAQHVPTEAHHAPTEEGRLVSTEAQHMHTGAPHLFQELKTESLGTQDMPPKIEALGLMQTEEACEHLENDAKPKVIIKISFC